MRRSIAAVLIASGLIVVAAGCKVTTTQKQAVARELTSAILSSVFLIESQGHHQNDQRGAIQTATVVAPPELSSEPIEAPPVDMEVVGDTSTALQSAQVEAGDRCLQEQPSESPQVIRTKAMEVAASGLTPAPVDPRSEVLPLPVHYAESLTVGSHVNFKPLTACVRNEATRVATAMALARATSTAMSTSLSRSENGVVVCQLTIARHDGSQEIEKQGSDCPSLRTRIGSRIEVSGTRRIVVSPNVTSDEKELSTLVRTSLCFVTTGPSN
jgi:hypothetical protein